MAVTTPSDNWLASVKKRHWEIFSELNVLLRALDRFFNIENLPLSREDMTGRSFFEEISAARDTILRIIGLMDMIIPESKKNAYWFQKFAHSKFLTDKKRDVLREELYKQDRPEKSFFLLYDSVVNLKGVITDILRTDHISYLTYANIGEIVGRELRENLHFNPFQKDLDPEFDIIENREISRVVKGIREQKMRKYVSVILLHMFRFLRYLRYADTSTRFGSLYPSLLIILLLRSEGSMFVAYLDTVSRKSEDEEMRMMRAISYQFTIEAKRVFLQELREIFKNRAPQYLKGKIENSHGILKNLTEQSVVQVVSFFDPDIRGSDIFDTFLTKREQSIRLREDILVLERFLALVQEGTPEKRLQVFDALRNFMLYFQSFTFKLLRYDDYEEFVSFFQKVFALNREELKGKGFEKLKDKMKQFRVFIGTCLRQVSDRAELADVAVDMTRVEGSISQYLQ